MNQSISAKNNDMIISRSFSADMTTPVALFKKLREKIGCCYLLESVVGGSYQGRYSTIGWAPDLIWRCDGEQSYSAQLGQYFRPVNLTDLDDQFRQDNCAAFDQLRLHAQESQIPNLPSNLPSLAAGLFGYCSYEMIRHVEKIDGTNPAYIDVPDALFIRPTMSVIFDHVEQTLTLCAIIRRAESPDSTPHKNTENLEKVAHRAIDEALAWANEVKTGQESAASISNLRDEMDFFETPSDVMSTLSKEEFIKKVDRAKKYIADGDIFQVVLSQCFSTDFDHDPLELYRSVRRINPSPYLFFFDFGNFQLVGSSPELLVGIENGQIKIKPIAGTRPRGTTSDEDQELAQELLADDKECAEHLMLLDLARNDVGRCAEPGTVSVGNQFIIEKYSHVMHIASEVTGKLSSNHGPLDALFAGFPAGTVSGAPKIRAMEIIEELEPFKRGPYAGTVGYFGADGNVDSCILLRTGLVKDGRLYVQAGGGIVYDSDPDFEYEESRNKARALLRAAQIVKNNV